MTKENEENCEKEALAQKGKKVESVSKQDPQWTSGLRRIYDSVLEEPLPDSFKDLLSKLDDDGKRE